MSSKRDNYKDENNNEEVNEQCSQDNEETILDLGCDNIDIEEPAKELSPLEQLQLDYQDLKKSNLRIQADYENYKKRNRELSSRMYATGIADALEAVFPAMDSLDLAANMYKDEKDRAGIDLIIKQFMMAFEKLGVKEIEAEGKEFDPNLHEAVSKCENSEDKQASKVVEVYRKGYILGEKVLRPSMVKVTS